MTNHLASSTSPYLLQHAHNPVDWYPWDPEALERARREDKPIFLSIGYAACHWCHVMAHESFENPDTAAFMNEHFINIKVDREERPDLDSIYMSAVVALTGQGGWPMSLFLTPDLKPFFGGTYFPPESRHGLLAFKELLIAIYQAWENHRAEINLTGNQVAARLIVQSSSNSDEGAFTPESLAAALKTLIDNYDWNNGGWGGAPKFPQPMTIDFLLRRAAGGLSEALKPVMHVLAAMDRGGMYDVVGGGFARYSTDATWHIPHFEKMLYDNAQLARVYLHAWQMTGDPSLRSIIEETLAFVAREMLSPEGGFYSSLDADSEGEEGKYYAWTMEEVRDVLGESSELFESAYGVTLMGNWEGKNVLHRVLDDAALSIRFKIESALVSEKLADCRARLLSRRASRVRPGTDDKVLTAWNGLMLSTFAEAGRVLKNNLYNDIAVRNANFLLTALRPEGKLRRAWRQGKASTEVFLEDYASLILGLLELYQNGFDNRWFLEARELAAEMIARFNDPTGGFFDTPSDAETLLSRPKDLQDSATPCGNALAAEALLKLASYTGKDEWRRKAEQTLGVVTGNAVHFPSAYARWLSAADFALADVKQVAIMGTLSDRQTQVFLTELNNAFRPNMIVALSSYPPLEGVPALLLDRPMLEGKPTAYVCEGFVCKLPVTSLEDLIKQL